MIDGDRGHGTDVIVRPNEDGILPYVSPSEFVVIVPTELQRAAGDEITNLHQRLLRQSLKITATLERCIGYDPNIWRDFHYFNEWLQTTPKGNTLLEEKIGRPVSGLKSSAEIKAHIKEGRFRIQ